ncbi:hypothetical protein SLEP1_g27858 [Rubroshorea leprosula]|uniref:Uncharacterized protein n=1 Tax=Rubroshorea leprosula TaxID=152421 RepID=A0AAV5K1F9_9ROSI|nr:hypothetical protein SLEP1_g27858 [Rubroshorea leprosula]
MRKSTRTQIVTAEVYPILSHQLAIAGTLTSSSHIVAAATFVRSIHGLQLAQVTNFYVNQWVPQVALKDRRTFWSHFGGAPSSGRDKYELLGRSMQGWSPSELVYCQSLQLAAMTSPH